MNKIKTMLIDSHAHLTSSDFNDDLDVVLARAKEAGISQIFNICTNLEELEKGIILNQKYPWIQNVGATTPHDVETIEPTVFEGFKTHAYKGNLAAIGETGLDYHYEYSPRQKQIESLRNYMSLALEIDLPIVIHCREAFADLFEIFEGYKGKVLLHCFTGTFLEAQEALKRNFFISFSGIVTFKKSIQLQSVAKEVPLSHMMIETDAPYLAPQRKRGCRNEPSFLKETAQFLAQLKEVSLEELQTTTAHNALSFFKSA